MITIQMNQSTSSRTQQGSRDTSAEQLPASIRNRLAQQGLVTPTAAKPVAAGKPPTR